MLIQDALKDVEQLVKQLVGNNEELDKKLRSVYSAINYVTMSDDPLYYVDMMLSQMLEYYDNDDEDGMHEIRQVAITMGLYDPNQNNTIEEESEELIF